MNNLSLYNITNKFVDLMNKAEEGELTEEEYNELGQELDLKLKTIAQRRFEEEYPQLSFLQIFGKNYL